MRTSDLAALSLAERLQTMETLWATLDAAAQSASVLPAWHQAVVTDRLQRLRDGSESVSSLESAFDNIARSIAARQAKIASAE